MSEKVRREKKDREEAHQKQVKGLWATSRRCRESDFVNCRFGESGPCHTLGHVSQRRDR